MSLKSTAPLLSRSSRQGCSHETLPQSTPAPPNVPATDKQTASSISTQLPSMQQAPVEGVQSTVAQAEPVALEVAAGRVALHFIGCGAGINAEAACAGQAIDSSTSAVDASEFSTAVRAVRDCQRPCRFHWGSSSHLRARGSHKFLGRRGKPHPDQRRSRHCLRIRFRQDRCRIQS